MFTRIYTTTRNKYTTIFYNYKIQSIHITKKLCMPKYKKHVKTKRHAAKKSAGMRKETKKFLYLQPKNTFSGS